MTSGKVDIIAVARGSTLVLEEGTKTPRRIDLDMLMLDFAGTLTVWHNSKGTQDIQTEQILENTQ